MRNTPTSDSRILLYGGNEEIRGQMVQRGWNKRSEIFHSNRSVRRLARTLLGNHKKGRKALHCTLTTVAITCPAVPIDLLAGASTAVL